MTKGLEQLYMSYLKDRAAAVREVGIEKIPLLIRVFGGNWLGTFITKLADILTKDSNYSSKITALYSMQVIRLTI
jgi:serine/threonine-protein phosphatase 2A regulatory subunit A